MNILIEVSGGTGVATWEDETGVEFEVDVGEISSDWLDNQAEAHFGNLTGEDVTIEVVDLDLITFGITFVDVYEGGSGYTTVEAYDREEAELKFEKQSDGCAIILIKEVK